MKLCYMYIRLKWRSDDNDKNVNLGPIYKYKLYKWLYKGHKICINKVNIDHYESSIKYNKIYIYVEISGIEPEITICKIDVLPIKLYPL